MSWKSVESIKYVNNKWFCSGSSLATSGSTIIGENTGVFIGGLPQGYTIVRKDEGKYDKSVQFLKFYLWDRLKSLYSWFDQH